MPGVLTQPTSIQTTHPLALRNSASIHKRILGLFNVPELSIFARATHVFFIY